MCLPNCASNYFSVVFIFFSFLKISDTLVSDSDPVKGNEYCKFELNNGEVIDLSPLLNASQPLIATTNASLYIYHPCTDVALPAKQVGVCNEGYGLCYFKPKTPTDKPVDYNKVLKNETQGNFTLLAFNIDGVFRENPMHQVEIVFKHTENKTAITTYLRLECDEKIENYKLTITKTSLLEHALTLSSRYVCVHPPHYMSGGAVFFIILVVFVLLYFVGGLLILKFIRGATGVEMIPNHEFWCNLPQLAKNFYQYLTSCGKNTPDSYEKI